MNHPFKLKNAALIMALAAIYPLHVHGAAGIAQFAVGDVNVRRGQTSMPLNRGQQIESGDSIVTGARGQTQIRFSDGGLVALAPNSQFNIDKYQDDNKPEEDGFFASFLRGGMRAITGLVGKRSRENYKITTTTATIGIRGSAFSANYNDDGSTDIAGEQDGIVVCTNAGCVDLIVGESVKIIDDKTAPKRTAARSNGPTALGNSSEPVNPEVIERQDDQINGVLPGVSALFAVGQRQGNNDRPHIDEFPRGGLDPSTGQGTFVNGLMTRHEVPDSMQNDDESVLRVAANTVLGGSTIVEKTGTDIGTFGTVGSASDPGFVGWGYWISGRLTYSFGEAITVSDSGEDQESDNGENWTNGVHYVVGRPTPNDQMPMSGFARYVLVGGTAPTAYDEYDVLRTGILNDAGLLVDFLSGKLNAFINTSFMVEGQATPVVITGYGDVSDSSFSGNDDRDDSFYGFFTGTSASRRAGLVYQTYRSALGTIHGSVVLVQGSLEREDKISAMFATSDGGHFDADPRGGTNPSVGIGYFVGNELYLHDDGAESDNGYNGFNSLNGDDGGSAGIFAAASPVSNSGSSGERGAHDNIGWGYWTKGTRNGDDSLGGVHHIVGRPTANQDMPVTGVAQYTSIGGTDPTSTYDGAAVMGRLTDASLTVDFLRGTGTATVNTVFRESSTSPINVNISALPISFGLGNAAFGGSADSEDTNTYVRGFFVGNQASKAGLIYQAPGHSRLGPVTGSAALERGALSPSPLPLPVPE